jgi:hypothetical protein
MPTLYYKPVVGNNWGTLANWFTNAAGTTPAVAVPWVVDNAYKTYDLAFATGVTVSPVTGAATDSEYFGNGFTITGTCSIPVVLGLDDLETPSPITVFGGTYSAGVVLSFATISGGTFQNTITNTGSTTITTGTFQGAVSSTSGALTINGGLFQSTVSLPSDCNVNGGTFNGNVTFNAPGGGTILGGTFNSGFTQTAGNIEGGTFNGTYTRVAGNVTGGTFNNGIMYQFFRNGFPPPIAFGGYNTKALDVLGTGL